MTATIGWKSPEQAALSIAYGFQSKLLEGFPLFLYNDNELQIVVVRFKDHYGVGVITPGYTSMCPCVPLEYLKEDFLETLKRYKLDTDIYKTIIDNEAKNFSN